MLPAPATRRSSSGVGPSFAAARRARVRRSTKLEHGGRKMSQSATGLAAAMLVFAVSAPSLAHVTVLEGDIMIIDDATYRLWGVDVTVRRQACPDGWPARLKAAEALRSLIAGRTVSCEPKPADQYGRRVARCSADGEDLGAAMILSGFALALTRENPEYAVLEAQAKAARLGVHAHDCTPAWGLRP